MVYMQWQVVAQVKVSRQEVAHAMVAKWQVVAHGRVFKCQVVANVNF